MLVVDASCLFEVLSAGVLLEPVTARLRTDADHAAPHVIDVEVLGVIRTYAQTGRLDPTRADLAVRDLVAWPGTRYPHRPLLHRAWELRATVRGWDAMYVALAEALDAPLLTLDARLARAPGPRCRIETV